MKPEQLIGFIGDKLDTSPDYPFSGDRESAVFRHRGNRKWFALLMRMTALNAFGGAFFADPGDGAPDYGASGGRTPRICRQRRRSKE